jgi:hypothetical protein
MDETELSKKISASLQDIPTLIGVVWAEVRGTGAGSAHPAFVEVAAHHGSGWSLFDAIRTAARLDPATLAFRCLLPSIAHLTNVSAAELCDLMTDLRASGSQYSWGIREPLSKVFQRIRTLGPQCIEYGLMNAASVSAQDIQIFVSAAAVAAPAESLEYFLSLIRRESEAARGVALQGIASIADTDGTAILKPHVEEIRQAARTAVEAEGIALAGWDVLCRLSEIDAPARQDIGNAAVEGPHSAQAAISTWLTRIPPNRWSDVDLQRILKDLIVAAIRTPEIRNKVDAALDGLLGIEGAQQLILPVCDALCSPEADGSLGDSFPEVYRHLMSEGGLFAHVTSRWLLKPKVSFGALRSLLHHTFVAPELLHPDLEQFTAADEKSRVRAVRRLLGCSTSGEGIAQFMFSLASCPALQPWGQEAFRDVCQNYLLVEFPHAIRQFLNIKSKTLERSSSLGKCIRAVSRAIKSWDAVLRTLPLARELRPSEANLLTMRVTQIREQREIFRQARARSVFASSVTQFNSKQGTAVITRIAGQPPVLIQLKTFSHALELPSSERSDPLWGYMQRLMYLKDPE